MISFSEQEKNKFLNELYEFLKIPSISADPSHQKEMVNCSNWLKNCFKNSGCENVKIFETVADYIIQSNFDFQKQYDLLRLQQRIDAVSGLIIATAKRMILTKNIGTQVPDALFPSLKKLSKLVIDSQDTFIEAIQKFQSSRKDVIRLIHKSEELENMVDNTRTECLEVLYRLANENHLRMGDLAAIEGVIEYFEDISDAIKSATTSLDWLLLN